MLWRGVGALAGIAVAGAIAGHVAAGDDEPPTTRSVRVGTATLTVAEGWRVIAGPATTLSNGGGRMRVAVSPPGDASLVPPALRERAPRRAPEPARLAGYRAWSYGAVTVLPSTRGVLGIACDSGRCADAVRSISFPGGAILAPTPDLALHLRAPAPLATLDAARVSARSDLSAASRLTARGGAARPAQEAAPARRLAAAHRAALDKLRPVASPGLIAALSGAEHAYEDLAHASSATGFNAARAEIVTADHAVDSAVAGLARSGAPAVQPRPAPVEAPRGGGASLPALLLVLAIALVVGACAPAAVRRAHTRRTPSEPSEPCVLAPRRRTPIAPPPTYGRWNDPPTGPSAGATVGDARASAYGIVVDNVNVSVLE